MNIIVTGVSSGIGFETARVLATQGHKVLGISRSEPGGTNPFSFLPFDLSGDNISQFVNEKVKPVFPHVDALVNNAAVLINKPFEMITREDLLNVYSVNVFAVFSIVQSLLPLMREGSHIVNISSMGGITKTQKFPGLTAYSSSKGALSIFTECLAVELQARKISVNALALGAVQTEMLARAFPGFKGGASVTQIGEFVADFVVNGGKKNTGKVVEVSLSSP